MRSSLLILGLAALVMVPTGLAGQDWREVTSFRQRSGEDRLEVHVRYGAGELRIRPGTAGELYRADLRYDSDVFDPVTRYEDGYLEVGVESRGGGIRVRNTEAGELTLRLAPDIPLELDLDFGAVEAELDFGGLQVSRLDVETGASDTEIRFDSPNVIACERIDIAMGAAAFAVRGLGNANCQIIEVEGGVGDLTLDFDGVWVRDIRADVTMALGSVTLVVPRDVGVRVDKETFLTGFDRDGFTKRGNEYYSDNWDRAERRLELRMEGAFGSISIRRSAASTAATP